MGYCKPLISWPTNDRLNPLKPQSKTNLPYYTENIRNLIKKQEVGWPIIWRNLFHNCTRLNFDLTDHSFKGSLLAISKIIKTLSMKRGHLKSWQQNTLPRMSNITANACFRNESLACTPSFLPNKRQLWSYFLKRSILEILGGNNSALLTYFSRFIRTFQWSQRDINILAFPWVEIYTYLPCSSQKSPGSLNIYFCSKEASDLRLCRIRLYRP